MLIIIININSLLSMMSLTALICNKTTNLSQSNNCQRTSTNRQQEANKQYEPQLDYRPVSFHNDIARKLLLDLRDISSLACLTVVTSFRSNFVFRMSTSVLQL